MPRNEFFRDFIVTSPDGVWVDGRAYATLNAAVAAVGANEQTIVIASEQVITNITIPVNVTLKFEHNGSISNSAAMIILTTKIIAPNRQIFTGAGGITFSFGSELRSSWFASFEEAVTRIGAAEVTLVVSEPRLVAANCTVGPDTSLKWESPNAMLTVDAGITVDGLQHIEAGSFQLFAGAGTFTFDDHCQLKLSWFPRLRSAITWIDTSEVVLHIDGTHIVDFSDVAPYNISFDFKTARGHIEVLVGLTLIIKGDVYGGFFRIFSGDGTVICSRGFSVSAARMTGLLESTLDFGDTLRPWPGTVSLQGFAEPADGGGGEFYWDPLEDKDNHDGGTIIDPHHTALPGAAAWYTGVGIGGIGCWKRNYNSVVDVRWFGATGDGVTDDVVAIQATIDSIPDFDTTYAPVTSGYSSGAGSVFLPTGIYYLGSQVIIPRTKSISLCGPGGWSSRIIGLDDYSILVEAGVSAAFGFVTIDGIAFDETGIEIDANRRGKTVIRRSVFTSTPDYAIYGNGASIVGMVIEDNKFTGCAGSISLTGLDVDLIEIQRNDFVRGHTNPDLDLGSYAALVHFNDFETRLVTDATVPWIRILRGRNKIIRNRFGGEKVGATHAPPRDAIQIGPDTPDGVLINDIEITGNLLFGSPTPSATQAAYFLRLNNPVVNMRFVDNLITEGSDYYTGVVHEYYIDDNLLNVDKCYGNVAKGNLGTLNLTIPLFSHGGQGFDWRDRLGDSRELLRQNLIRQSNDLTQSLWINTNVTIAKNAVGPDGIVNSACTITKVAAGSAHTRNGLLGTASNTDGNLVASVWLKAGTLSRARVYLVNSTNAQVIASRKVVNLYPEWERFDFRFTDIDSAKSYIFYITPGGMTTAELAATGTILVFEPSAWNGYDPPDRPMQNIATGGTQHSAQQFNSLRLGQVIIGYGAAAPVAGRYEVGDIIFDTAPAPSGTVGWVCTTAGSPGTWKTFGAIAA